MCFSLLWLRDLLIYIVIICAIVAFVKLLLPIVLKYAGEWAAVISQAVHIIMWAIITIILIYIVFALFSCLLGGGGLRLPRL